MATSTLPMKNTIQNATVDTTKVTSGNVYFVKDGYVVTVTGIIAVPSTVPGATEDIVTGLPKPRIGANVAPIYAVDNSHTNSYAKLTLVYGSNASLRLLECPASASIRFMFSYVCY